MPDFAALAASAQGMYTKYQASQSAQQGPGGADSYGQQGGGGGGYGQNNVNDIISNNLTAMLAPQASSQPQTQSRDLGSFVSSLSGLANASSIDESRVNAAHQQAYNQQGGGMSDQDAGAAAGKEVFDRIFGNNSNNSRDPLADDVTELYGTAAKEQTGQTSRAGGLGSLASMLSGVGGQSQPPRQKDAFEKVVDLISREVAKVSYAHVCLS